MLQLHPGAVHQAVGQLGRERADADDAQCVADGLVQRCDERGVALHSDAVDHLGQARMDHLGRERPRRFAARGQQRHEPARRLADALVKVELERGERQVECLREIGREPRAEERRVHDQRVKRLALVVDRRRADADEVTVHRDGFPAVPRLLLLVLVCPRMHSDT